jgi:monoterpene epsilon-lactone hydrolase
MPGLGLLGGAPMHRRRQHMNIPMEIVRTVVAISETGSLSKAGERLGLSQPAVSSQINRLQSLVGGALFLKTANGTTTTPQRDRRHPRIAGLEAAAGRMVGAARTARRSRIDLAGAADVKCEAVDCDGVPASGRSRRAATLARAAVFPRRRLLLRLDCQPSPDGDGGRAARRARARSRSTTGARPSIPTRPPMRTRSRRGASCASKASRRNIAVGGDSAGGNLTLGLISRLRAAGEELPACAWLVSPWTDLTMSGATLDTKDAIDPLIHKAYLDRACGRLCAAAIDRSDPLISPLFADLAGFPPLLIQVGSAETLAGGRDAACRGRRRRRCRCDARNLAAHDPCVAGLEC